MKSAWVWRTLISVALLVACRPAPAPAQTSLGEPPVPPVVASRLATEPPARFQESDWSGPRMGFMVAPGDAAIARRLKSHGLGSVVSQFGWHFEKRIVPFSAGPQLVTECVPLVGGVEFGKLVPSVTLVMGLRMRSGYEFGMGPSFSATSATSGSSALVFAVGKSLDYGDVRIPLNLAVSTNRNGTMVTLVAGYAMHQVTR